MTGHRMRVGTGTQVLEMTYEDGDSEMAVRCGPTYGKMEESSMDASDMRRLRDWLTTFIDQAGAA